MAGAGYNFPAGQHVLPTTLARVNAEHPDVVVRLEEQNTGAQLAALADGSLDIALVYGRPMTADFQCRRLLRLPMVAIVAPGHPWAGRPGVPFAELGRQPCVLFSRDRCPAMYDAILSAAERTGTRLNVAQVIDDSGATAIHAAVKSLVAFGSVSRAMFAAAAAGIRLLPVRLYDPTPTVDLYAVWPDNQPDPLRDAFLKCLDAAGPFRVPPLADRRRPITAGRTG